MSAKNKLNFSFCNKKKNANLSDSFNQPCQYESDYEPTPEYMQNGLTNEDVQNRISEGKINGDQTIKTKSVFEILRTNIFTFFNLLFIILAVILAFFVRNEDKISTIGNFGFLVLVVINSAIGTIQELRAKRTIDKLSLISAPKAKVIRNGVESEIAIKNLVLDDLTILSAGTQICADAVVTDGSIEVNESLITGEPDAILKSAGDSVMSGSFVVSGKAKAKVVHIGLDNFAMKISAGAKYFKKPNSEIWRSLMFFVRIMALIIVPLGIALFCVKYFQGNGDSVNTIVTNTIGSVVGMVPTGLVALTSAVFCVSVIRLAKHKTLAQDLYCVETLARVDVLCLDKTGTITEGTMEVNTIKSEHISEEEFKQLLKNFVDATGDENATANALKSFVHDLQSTGNVEQVVPFSSQRKWSGAKIDGTSYVLGASEFVFENPSEDIVNITKEMAEKGFRVLVLASSKNSFEESNLPSALQLIGYIFITDKIRTEAPDTLRFFREQGVQVKIISGDNPTTVRAVAMRAGLEECDNIIDMSTLKTDEEVIAAAEKYTIFGRVLPNQKLLLVKALKKNGHTVAMTGDGVNDVLALKEADCSVAMASGSDAAKNVSSLVLLDSNFASMPKVVAEGRRSINNLERSASLYLMKTMYNVMIAILFMMVTTPLPFEPRNLTLIGGLTIGIPSVILALEPNKDRVTGRFLPKVLSASLPGSLTVLLGIGATIIADNYFLTLANHQMKMLCVIITTFVAFMYLFKVSLPLTWIHSITFIAMVGLYAACFFVKIPFFDIQKFFGLYTDVTWDMGKAILSIAAVLLPIFVGLSLLMKKFGLQFIAYLDQKMHKKQEAAKLTSK